MVLLLVVPLAVVSALAIRAAQNERGAIASSMRAQLQQHASDAGAAYARDIATLNATLQLSEPGAPGSEPWRGQASFAHTVVLPPDAPSDASKRPHLKRIAGVADDRTKACRVWLSKLADTARDPTAPATFLADCKDTRTDDGRHAWPLVALHPSARVRPSRDELAQWLSRYGASQSEAERAAQQLEIRAADWLPSEARQQLSQLAAGGDHDSSGASVARERLRRTPDEPELRWNDAQSQGLLLRRGDGSYVGFVIDRSSLQRGLNSGWPGGIDRVAFALNDRGGASDPRDTTDTTAKTAAFQVLAGGTSVALRWRDPFELEQRSARSRQLVIASAAVAALGLLGLTWLLWSRLREQRQLSALRTDFVAAVSHELRTPIASLRMLSELLADDKLEPEEVPEAQRSLVREAQRLGETVDQLLSFSRMQAGKLHAKRSHCELSQLVEEAIAVFEQRHQLTIVRSIAPDIVGEVDGQGLKMALRNLLENARKHAPDGTPYEVALERDESGVTLSVSDHGPGIPERHQRSIFQPFERVDDRLTGATEGSGIGLSLVRHVARAHGGRASVRSTLGKGATFKLHLPLS